MTARTCAGVHHELRRRRGSAVGLPCAHPECYRPAAGWGLLGHPTNIGYDSRGKVVKWSTDLGDYAPMCRSHNGQRDGGGNWTLCPRGHARIAWGTTPNGQCRGCRREWDREARSRRKTSRPTAGTKPTPGADNTERGRS